MTMMRPPVLFVVVFVTSAVTTIGALGVSRTLQASSTVPSPLRLPTSGVSIRGQRLLQLQLHARASSNELLSLLSSNTGEKVQNEDNIKGAISALESSFRSSS